MLFWICLDTIFFLLYLVGMYCLEKDKDIHLLAIFLMTFLTVITVIREGVWTDYYSYVELFYENTEYLRQEPLFLLSINVLRSLGFSSQMLFLIYGVGINILFWKSIKYYFPVAKDRLTAVLLFESMFCAWMFTINALRQGMAMAIIFWGYQFIEKHKNKCFYFCVVMATLFHYSAVLALVIPLIHKCKFRKNWLIFFIFLSYVIGTQLDVANDLVMPILEFLADMTGIGSTYVRYALSEKWVSQEGVISSVGMGALATIVLSMVILLLLNMRDERSRFVAKMISLALCIRGLMWFSVPLMRLRYYFELFLIVGVVLIIHRVMDKDRRILASVWILLYVLLHLGSIYVAEKTQTIDFGINLKFIE